MKLLLLSPGDTALGDIIGRYLNGNRVADENFDIIHTQLARDCGGDDDTVGQLYLEDGVRESLHDHAILKFNQIALRQELILLNVNTVVNFLHL